MTRFFAALAGVIVSLGIWPLYANYIERAGFNPEIPQLNSFTTQWQAIPPVTDWRPSFAPAKTEFYQFFQHEDQIVGLSVLYYRNQIRGAGLISSSNKLVQEKDPKWNRAGTSTHQETIGNRRFVMWESRLQDRSGPLLVWHWYWVDGQFTANDYIGKLLQTKEKMLMRGDDGAALAVFARYTSNPEEARLAMREFLSANMIALDNTLVANRKP